MTNSRREVILRQGIRASIKIAVRVIESTAQVSYAQIALLNCPGTPCTPLTLAHGHSH